MSVDEEVKKLINKYFDTQSNTIQIDFVKELSAVVNNLVAKAVKYQTKDGVYLSLREVEELLLLVRDLETKYESLSSTTASDVIKLDEIKQTEYKLTEHLLKNR